MENEFGEKLDSNRYATSILQFNPGEQCALCKAEHIELVRHEVFHGTGRRELSKKYGLWITVCPACHSRIHSNPTDPAVKDLQVQAQHQALHKYGWDTAKFIEVFGKNYI